MAIIKNILGVKVSLVIVILCLILLTAGGAVAYYFLRDTPKPLPFFGDTSLTPAEFQFGPAPAFGDFDFFAEARDTLIKNESDFIEANLSDMIIRVYSRGALAYEAPILAKGREGSWWETPAGIYQVDAKIRNHFSRLANVHLPWSLPFHGNFFIHGWPHYPGGTPVATEFSGGCIRLSNESARRVYDLARVGMPIIVFEESFIKDDFIYHPNLPKLSANAYLVADLRNNYILLEYNRNKILPVASITKIMTALVTVGHIRLENNVSISQESLVQTSHPRLRAGSRVSAYNLLFPLLLESSNEAAEVLARHLGRNRFISLMNRKARAIGMSESQFADPSGISGENKSNASELFNLARYLYNNRSFILRLSAGKITDSVYGEPIFPNLRNFNLFEGNPSFVGGKTGKTNIAKETFLGVFRLELAGEERPVAIIILGSDDNRADAEKILEWLTIHY